MPHPFRHTVAPLMLVALASAASAQTTAGQSQAPSRAQVAQGLDQRFKALDTNGDGTITKAEMDAAEARARQQAAARIAKRAEEGFAKLDTDKNGQLSLAEFKASIPPVQAGAAAAVLQRLDANKDGKITRQEFGAPTLATFDRLDTNKDGKISAQERSARRSSARTSR
ncbi:EF-hand domain-containing protein [Sphingomonas sp.]|uniref:EF-hand domain-containing protein n=1 Tax=Sphingomonas sp. TaxID=28214 RepID=UPI00183FFFEB|nr:EF-hand domain-containing protein [Sphingomonas sp.]MBA3510535.1 EF-hand domain-containing protein [Sphingomonas sp.]